jgi:hypothetical protein
MHPQRINCDMTALLQACMSMRPGRPKADPGV